MKNISYLSFWVRQFFLEYLISQTNLSKNTQRSYRDTFRLMLPFLVGNVKKPLENLFIHDMTIEIIKNFLHDLELNRHCSVSTRNQRLAAIHTFAKFIALNNPEDVEWSRQIQLIPFKKSQKTLISYLEKFEIDALLDAPDKKTEQGIRDYALLLFLYNTGARSDEAAQLIVENLTIDPEKKHLSSVLINGKGNKLRRCPLWQQTVYELSQLISGREQHEHVFLNRCKQPLTRFGIYNTVKRCVKKIMPLFPSLKQKRVSPHTIRHTTATHLLRAGVDINTIRAWLGHVSIDTTNIYTEVDIEMKARALAFCEVADKENKTHWRDDKDLMKFLDAI